MVSKNLSACLSVVNFDPNYLRTSKPEWVLFDNGTITQEPKPFENVLQIWLPELILQAHICFKNSYFLTKLPWLAPIVGGMKFATQISPPLNSDSSKISR